MPELTDDRKRKAKTEPTANGNFFQTAFNNITGMFSKFGQRMMAAIREPFQNKQTTKPSPGNTNNTSKAQPPTLMSIFFGLYSFIMKLAKVFVNIIPVLKDFWEPKQKETDPVATPHAATPGEAGGANLGPASAAAAVTPESKDLPKRLAAVQKIQDKNTETDLPLGAGPDKSAASPSAAPLVVPHFNSLTLPAMRAPAAVAVTPLTPTP